MNLGWKTVKWKSVYKFDVCTSYFSLALSLFLCASPVENWSHNKSIPSNNTFQMLIQNANDSKLNLEHFWLSNDAISSFQFTLVQLNKCVYAVHVFYFILFFLIFWFLLHNTHRLSFLSLRCYSILWNFLAFNLKKKLMLAKNCITQKKVRESEKNWHTQCTPTVNVWKSQKFAVVHHWNYEMMRCFM